MFGKITKMIRVPVWSKTLSIGPRGCPCVIVQMLYKIKTVSDNGNEQSTEWESWDEMKESFQSCAAIWIAAMVMTNDGLASEHKIIISDNTDYDMYTFIIHPHSPSKSTKFKIRKPLCRTSLSFNGIDEPSKLFLDGMMLWIGHSLHRHEREVELIYLKASTGHKTMSFWTKCY